MNGFGISPSDDQNGADAESHRSTLRPPPKPYAVSNQNLIPPSPKGSRKPAEPRNGSPARSNTRAHSPFLSPGPHSPDLRRDRPSLSTTHRSTVPHREARLAREVPERTPESASDHALTLLWQMRLPWCHGQSRDLIDFNRPAKHKT
jgi:hypothetical protein